MAKTGDKQRKREIRKDITRLKKEGNYQEILKRYGIEQYRKAVSKKYKEIHINKLFQEGSYEDIYLLYGEKEYNKLMFRMMLQEANFETGKNGKELEKALMEIHNPIDKIKFFLKRRVLPNILSLAMTVGIPLGAAGGTLATFWELDSNEREQANGQIYANEIEAYNKRLEEYAVDIQNLNLDDFEIIMKVIDDTWKKIEGYGQPKIDAWGYWRLDITEGGRGICRNIADDTTAQLNAINPEFNARNIVVYMDNEALEKYDAEMADIGFKLGSVEWEGQQLEETHLKKEIEKKLGNHVITAVDIPGKNITLAVDSTNGQIGVVIDGKIHMFSNKKGEGITLTPLGQFLMNGALETVDVWRTQVLSFRTTEYTLEELEEMYGTAAQNEVLDRVRAKCESNKAGAWRESYAYAVDIKNQVLQEGTRTQIGQELSYDTNINISETGEQDTVSTTTSMEEDEYGIR